MDFILHGQFHDPPCKLGLELRPTSTSNGLSSKWTQGQAGRNITSASCSRPTETSSTIRNLKPEFRISIEPCDRAWRFHKIPRSTVRTSIAHFSGFTQNPSIFFMCRQMRWSRFAIDGSYHAHFNALLVTEEHWIFPHFQNQHTFYHSPIPPPELLEWIRFIIFQPRWRLRFRLTTTPRVHHSGQYIASFSFFPWKPCFGCWGLWVSRFRRLAVKSGIRAPMMDFLSRPRFFLPKKFCIASDVKLNWRVSSKNWSIIARWISLQIRVFWTPFSFLNTLCTPPSFTWLNALSNHVLIDSIFEHSNVIQAQRFKISL